MPSNIDATQPPALNPTTAAMRANMLAAKTEIELIQTNVGNLRINPISFQLERWDATTGAYVGVTVFENSIEKHLSAISSSTEQDAPAAPTPSVDWSFSTSSYAIGGATGSLFDAQVLPNGNILYCVARDTVGSGTGVCEVNPVSGKVVFEWRDPTWTPTTTGPECAFKYSNGNYLIANVDAVSSNMGQVYEMRPDHSVVWSWNPPAGTTGNRVMPVMIDGVDCVIAFGYGLPSQSYIYVFKRSDQTLLWSMGGFTEYVNGGDYRKINGTNYLVATIWNSATNPRIELINYDSKTIVRSIPVTQTVGYGPLDARFLDDDTIIVVSGYDSKFFICDVNTGATIYTSPAQQATRIMCVHPMEDGRQIVWCDNASSIYGSGVGPITKGGVAFPIYSSATTDRNLLTGKTAGSGSLYMSLMATTYAGVAALDIGKAATSSAIGTPILSIRANDTSQIKSLFTVYGNYNGTINSQNGQINLGSQAQNRAVFGYNGAGTGALQIDNSYDAAGGNIDLRVRTNATAVIPLRVSGTGNPVVKPAVAPPAAGGTAGGLDQVALMFSSTANLGIYFGTAVPTIAAAKGSLYMRTDGSSTSTRAYINTDGATTWTNLTTAA